MIVECGKCGFKAESEIISSVSACPKCGGIYAKIDAAIAAAEAKKKAKCEAEVSRLELEERNREIAQRRAHEKKAYEALSRSICLACGSLGHAKKLVRGSFASEIGLYLIALLFMATIILIHIGLILFICAIVYSISRVFSKRTRVCAVCGSRDLIPASTPRGREELVRRGILTE